MSSAIRRRTSRRSSARAMMTASLASMWGHGGGSDGVTKVSARGELGEYGWVPSGGVDQPIRTLTLTLTPILLSVLLGYRQSFNLETPGLCRL